MQKFGVATWLLGILMSVVGCSQSSIRPSTPQTQASQPIAIVQNLLDEGNLLQARQGFKTKLLRQKKENEPVPIPPKNLFQVVQYAAPPGKMAAYLSIPPRDGKKHPAIIWITGGFGNDIGSTVWEPQTPDNDQSASAFRKAGIITMFPALRGGNKNPGVQEGFFGEVNDVLAAAYFLSKHPSVDPKRIYLGGHSTGGTLALLAAESTDGFRAVFSFGPVAIADVYGQEELPYDISDEKESDLRAPMLYLHAIANPTFLFEGGEGGNADSLNLLLKYSKNSALQGFVIKGADHFSVLAPITPLIARKILADKGADCTISFTQAELNRQIH